jgi:hypothetical protein
MSDSSPAIETRSLELVSLRPVYRYATGSAIIMLVAMSADYTLSYLTPVLALGFLAPGAKAPTLKSSVAFLVTIAAASLAGVLFTRFFLAFPLVFLPMLTLVIFHIYYTASLQKMKMWLIISLLLIPMVSMETASLGSMVAVNLFVNAFVAIILINLVYFIFPSRDIVIEGMKATAPPALSAYQRYDAALKNTLVVLPVLVLFFVFNWSNALLVLIFIAILSMNPATSNKKAGIAIIAANFGGGIAAIVAFNLLTVVPDIIFLGLLVFLAGLLFGPVLFSKKPIAQLFGMAFSTFLLILGNVTSFRGEAGEAVWTRIFQLGIVVVYVVTAFALVGYFSSLKKSKNDDRIQHEHGS